jgi:hypothetical protein
MLDDKLCRPKPGRTLIVGSHLYHTRPDRRKLYPDALGVDMVDGPGVDRVMDLEENLPDDIGSFAHVECCSVLEHSRRPWLMAANIERLMLPGSTLLLAVPFVWRVHAYPSDYWRMTPEAVRVLFPAVRWVVLMFRHHKLSETTGVPSIRHDGLPYFCRTMTVGFGVKR